MEISTKLRYGARVLAELGLAYPDKTVPAGELAELQGVSVKYLEHILSSLKAAGIIIAERGMHGGYRLARSPENVTLEQVFYALEGSPAPVKCVDNRDLCPKSDTCPARPTWVELNNAIVGVLNSTTIADLAQRITQDEEMVIDDMYQI